MRPSSALAVTRLSLSLYLLIFIVPLISALHSASLPPEWASRVASGQMTSTASEKGLAANRFPVLGNGFVGATINDDSMYIAGVFNGYLTKDPSHRARVPSTVHLSVVGSTFGPAALDMERGTYFRRSTIPLSASCNLTGTTSCADASVVNGTVWVEQRWYAHRDLPHLILSDLRVWVDGTISSSDTTTFAVIVLSLSNGGDSKDFAFSPVSAPSAPYSIINGSTLVAETNTSALTGVSIATTTLPPYMGIATNNSLSTFITAIRTSIETSAKELVTAVEADWLAAKKLSDADMLWQSHVDAWATVWESGVELSSTVGGSEPGAALGLAAAVNMSIYSILSSIREDRPYGISPGGLTPGYNGHVFWDSSTWMEPGVLVLHPDLAGSMIEYRKLRLPGAEQKAKSYVNDSYAGAMFPWESGFTGEEVCPSWAPTGLREIHISGDIAFSVLQFWRMSKDLTWLRKTGLPLLTGIADFWVSKVDAHGNINDVIPPDEYHDHVNNSVYTNAVAKLALGAAIDANMVLNLPVNPQYQSVMDSIPILFDSALGVHPEYAGYTTGTTIKQADAILLGFPLEVPFGNMTATVRKNDLTYYANVTDPNGPAMTWAMQSTGLLEIGDHSGAASNFNRSYANQQQPFLVWTETPQGGTSNFITGAGGFLQAVLFGYPGIRIRSDSLFLRPQLFENVAQVTLRGVAYLGNRITIEYTAVNVSFTVHETARVKFEGRLVEQQVLTVTDESSGAVQLLSAASGPVELAINTAGFSLRAV